MKKPFTSVVAFGLLMFLSTAVVGQTQSTLTESGKSQRGRQHAVAAVPTPSLCGTCIRAHMEFLASDALRGRGSGTPDELVAATYVASQLRAYGVEPGGTNGGYIQRANLMRRKFTAAPRLEVSTSAPLASTVTWIFGPDFLVIQLTQPAFSGPLMKVNVDHEPSRIQAGAVVLITGQDKVKMRHRALSAAAEGAAGALLTFSGEPEHFEAVDKDLPNLPPHLEGTTGPELGENINVLELSAQAARQLEQVREGSILDFAGTTATERGHTWNVVGRLRGSDPKLRDSAVLLSAHLDHLGLGEPVDGDNIYNGADDDASGTSAVLELARVLGTGPRPRRTAIFALFGSEEVGGLGSTYFSQHPPVPLPQIAADLEFEMIGRLDPAVPDDRLWLSGWERSNLGPVLAAHGAHLVGDPHAEQNFFARSDNYILAKKKGVVAHTISSFGLHGDYHQPSDDLAHIDFRHLNAAIESLLRPIQWLLNSSFTPEWNKDGRP